MSPTQHALRSASSAKRWLSCPGSIRLIQSLNLPNSQSAAAAEGTAAHALAEAVLLSPGKEPQDYLGQVFEGHTVDRDMADAVAVYTNYVRNVLAELKGQLFVETRVVLQGITKPDSPLGPMFGTTDATVFQDFGVLHIIDLKYGRGVTVEAADNPQLMYYALGMAQQPEIDWQFDTVRMTIVQPRQPDPIRVAEITVAELRAFANRLREGADACEAQDPQLNPSEAACRWCPAAAACPALEQQVQQQTVADFSPALTDEKLAEKVKTLPLIQVYCKAVEAEAERRLSETGLAETVYGKWVAKRQYATWHTAVPQHEIAQALCEAGLSEEQVYKVQEPQLITPAVARKLLPKEQRKVVDNWLEPKQVAVVFALPDDPRPVAKDIVTYATQDFGSAA